MHPAESNLHLCGLGWKAPTPLIGQCPNRSLSSSLNHWPLANSAAKVLSACLLEHAAARYTWWRGAPVRIVCGGKPGTWAGGNARCVLVSYELLAETTILRRRNQEIFSTKQHTSCIYHGMYVHIYIYIYTAFELHWRKANDAEVWHQCSRTGKVPRESPVKPRSRVTATGALEKMPETAGKH